jgi:hypothetical protein
MAIPSQSCRRNKNSRLRKSQQDVQARLSLGARLAFPSYAHAGGNLYNIDHYLSHGRQVTQNEHFPHALALLWQIVGFAVLYRIPESIFQ